MKSIEKILETYKRRAASYSIDMNWLDKPDLFSMFDVAAFGNKKALDACAGTGCVANYLFSNGWEVTAVDISNEMLRQVPKEINRMVSDICNMPFEDNIFEMSICRQGLQYVNVKKAIKSLIKVTKSDIRFGHITIESSEDLDFWKHYFTIASPGRKNVFLPGEITKLAQKCGLLIVDENVIYDNASLLDPIKYLENDKRDYLITLIENKDQLFKERNGIVIQSGDIIYRRRWEFQHFAIK